jgi:hypothetical protein
MKRSSGLRACSLFTGVMLVAQFSGCGRVERNPIDDESVDYVIQSPTSSSGGAGVVPTVNHAGARANGGGTAAPLGGGGHPATTGEIAAAGEGGVAGVAGVAGAAGEAGAPACPLADPAIAERSCSGEGFIYEVPNLCLGDGGLSVSDDLLEVYCCGGVKRFCLSGEACPWRAGCVNSMATCSRAGMAPGTDWMAVIYCCEWGGPRDFYCSEYSQVRDEYSENPRY